MAATNFQFGNLSKKEAEGFARSWMEGARGRNFKNQQEKLDHLNKFQNAARRAGGIVGQKVKTRSNISKYVNFNYYKPSTIVKLDDKTLVREGEMLPDFDRYQKGEIDRIKRIKEGGRSVGLRDDQQDTGGQDEDSFTPDNTGFDDTQGFSGYDVGDAFAEGGRVGMAEGSGEEEIMLDEKTPDPIMKGDNDLVITGNELLENEMTRESGFIEKPASQTSDQEGIADDIPIKLRNDQNPEGATIVMNKPSIDLMGEKNFIKMVKDGLRYLRSRGKQLSDNDDEYIKKNFTDVAISSGEAVIQPELANVIGRKRLLALNERGKRRVTEAKRQSASEGGFIKKKFGDEVNEQGFIPTPVTKDMATFTVFKDFLKQRKPLRADIEKFIDRIPEDKGRLAILAGVETPLESSTLPELEAVIQTILNRVNDRTFEYRNINTVPDIMKQRSRRGTGSRMFMYDGLERTNLKNRLKEIINNPKVFQAGLDAAENVLTKGGGEPDYETEMLPADVFQYSVEGKASESNERNPKLKFYKQIGKHRFYQRVR
jgi:hypothetical protein